MAISSGLSFCPPEPLGFGVFHGGLGGVLVINLHEIVIHLTASWSIVGSMYRKWMHNFSARPSVKISGLNPDTVSLAICNQAIQFLSDGLVHLSEVDGFVLCIPVNSNNYENLAVEKFRQKIFSLLPKLNSECRTPKDFAEAANKYAASLDELTPISGYGTLSRLETLSRLQKGTIVEEVHRRDSSSVSR